MLLLVLAFAISGLGHGLVGDHAASAASYSHEILTMNHDAGGEPCDTEHTGQPHDTTCCVASSCSLCVPVVSSAVEIALSDAESTEAQLDDAHLSRAPSPQFRPPKLSANN